MTSNEALLVDADEYVFWNELRARNPAGMEELCARTGLDQSKVSAIVTNAAERQLVQLEVRERQEVVPVEGAADVIKAGLPERQAIQLLRSQQGPLSMPDFVQRMQQVPGLAINEVIRWGKARGWLERDQDGVSITERGRAAADTNGLDADERLLTTDHDDRIFLDELDDAQRVTKLLKNRPELAKLRKRTQKTVSLTRAGQDYVKQQLTVRQEQNVFTSDQLRSGEWKNITLRPYDVTLAAQTVRPAKIHPLRKIIEQTRRTFLEMGFTEVVSPMVESSFWNFDALFQPQDHPAREMQDTFYVDQPRQAAMPQDAGLVERVKRVHEDGGDTGSVGWGYDWQIDRALRPVLRTHTTAATIRALAANCEPPVKVFCVGWVFRNETISFKHLPVFHQVDGIILDENANLASLLGTLETFYKKMGFQKVKFKPAFYPYTEPSVDVVVYHEGRGKWIEMGGSGLFRPEVTVPLGCRHPVAAWGLGMERLAMIRYEIADIRDLYQADIDDMQGVPLCQ